MAHIERRLGRLRRDTRRLPTRDDTEHLRSTRANAARLNAAIEELDAGRGSLTSMSQLQDCVGKVMLR